MIGWSAGDFMRRTIPPLDKHPLAKWVCLLLVLAVSGAITWVFTHSWTWTIIVWAVLLALPAAAWVWTWLLNHDWV